MEVHRNFGAYIDQIAPGSESFGVDVEAIDAEREVLCGIAAILGDFEVAVELISLAEQFGVGGNGCAIGIVDLDAQFSADALGMEGAGGEKNGQAKEYRVSDAHLFYVSTKGSAALPVRRQAAALGQQSVWMLIC
jgi:hypothetical protein